MLSNEVFSIVKVDTRNYRTIARENWGLTKEQMKGMHVHHRIPVSEGGTNDPTNLYVCSPSFHRWGWHNGEDFIEWASAGGRKGGKKGGRKGGTKTAELGVGAHAPGVRSKAGEKTAELGVGIHAPGMQSKGGKTQPREAKVKGGTKGSKTTKSQKWMCLETGHISNPCGLSSWQKARGIDTSMRVKVG